MNVTNMKKINKTKENEEIRKGTNSCFHGNAQMDPKHTVKAIHQVLKSKLAEYSAELITWSESINNN